MSDPQSTRAEALFSTLIDAYAATPGVTLPDPAGGRAFGAQPLQVHGSIFAMLCDDRLVVKLRAHRVAELIGAGTGAPFGTAGRRPMKEWVAVLVEDEATWRALSSEALAFVGGD